MEDPGAAGSVAEAEPEGVDRGGDVRPVVLAVLLGATAIAGLPPSSARAQATGRTTGFDGVTLEYEQVSTGDPTLVLVHGWMCDRTYWREQRTALAADFGVVLVDLGGHGGSTATRTDWSIDSFARDVRAVLRALNLENVVLVGHSMGGPVVAEAALLEPDRVAGVVGVDTYQYLGAPWLQGDGIADLVSRLSEDFEGTTAGFVQAMIRASPDPTRVSALARRMTRGSPAVGVAATRSMFEWYRGRAVGTLNALDRPIWTINSAEYVGTDVDALSSLVPGIEVRLMAGVGHFVMLDDPAAFNRLLVEAVEGVLAGG